MSKYRGKTVYAHNLSRFDVVFLFKEIGKLQNDGYKVTVLNKDDKIISINIVKGKNTCLVIKDSLLLLPASLELLATQFNLKVGKLIEPVYVGPGHAEYKSTNLDHYNKAVERVSDFNEWQQTRADNYHGRLCSQLYKFARRSSRVAWRCARTSFRCCYL